MNKKYPWKHLVMAMCVSLFLSSVASAEDVDRLRAEVFRLQLLLQETRFEMFNRAQLSPHGFLDPGVQSLSAYATQLEHRLSQTTRRLVKEDAEFAQSDLAERLELISADVAVMAERLAIPGVSRYVDPTWRRVEIDGTAYYLVPVRARDRSPAISSGGKPPDLPRRVRTGSKR